MARAICYAVEVKVTENSTTILCFRFPESGEAPWLSLTSNYDLTAETRGDFIIITEPAIGFFALYTAPLA